MVPSVRPETSTSGDRSSRWLPDGRDDALLLVAGVTLLALLVRLVFLGDRVAHWDEGRVGYWIIHYQETGSFAYRSIIHGPFIQHVNRWLFELVPANDFTMRLPVALVGGLLPLSAWLFREHLRKIEMVAMALFLAFNPILLYYSRFMRSDVLVAAFMFVAFGLFVRFYDTRRVSYVFAAAAFTGFGFAAKENAAVYVLTWIGAAALLADQALFRPREYDSGYQLLVRKGRSLYLDRVRPWFAAAGSVLGAVADVIERALSGGGERADEAAASDDEATNGGRADAATASGPRSRDALGDDVATFLSPFGYLVDVGFAAFVFFAVLLFFYAPRGAGIAGLQYPPAPPSGGAVGLWESFRSPSAFFGMLDATWQHASQEFGNWFAKAERSGDASLVQEYGEFLGHFVEAMVTKAAPLTAFAIFGFLLERYGSKTSRNLVMFGAYTGFVSVLGYPLGTDIANAWIVVHALVPLSIPAAVGLTRVFDWGHEAFVREDTIGVGIAVVLLLLVAGQVAGVAVQSVYVNDQAEENPLVQYAQPAGDPRSELQTMAAVARENRTGSDVLLYYGEQGDEYDENLAFVEQDPADWDSADLDLHPLCANWFNTLPMPWYFAKDDVNVTCAREESTLTERIRSPNPPPMVITQDADESVPTDALESAYVGRSYELRTYGTETTFWVRRDLANGTESDSTPAA